MKQLFATGLLLAAASVSLNADIVFSTFVTGSDIGAAENTQHNTIAFTYAGDKFVGSIYTGANNAQLYQTDLTGNNVTLFGDPVPGGENEIVLGSATSMGGFTSGNVFAGNDSNIYQYGNAGGAPTLFASGFNGTVRQIMFDQTGNFGGNMLVTTTSGNIYKVDSTGAKTVLASVGEDTEGMDVAGSAWGPYNGDLLVSSEGSGALRLIDSAGMVTLVDVGGAIHEAETVSFVPTNLGASGNPVEGFYIANYAQDIQFAGPSQFAGLGGDAIVTEEDTSSSVVWDIHYDSVNNVFTKTQVGTLPDQSEDGIFVTANRIADATPEPSTWVTMAGAMLLLAASRRRRASARP